jgi:hypothetical protein
MLEGVIEKTIYGSGDRFYLYGGNHSLRRETIKLFKTIYELVYTLIPEAGRYFDQEPKGPDTLLFGSFSSIDKSVNGQYLSGNRTDGGITGLIMVHADIIRNYIEKSSKNIWAKVVYYYTVMHELFHAYFEKFSKSEYATWSSLPKFFRHMAFISWGEMKNFYLKLEKYAKAGLEGFLKKPYDVVITASYSALSSMLNYVRGALSNSKLSAKEKAQLSALEKQIQAQMEKTKKGKSEKEKTSNKKGEPPSKKGEKGKSTKESNSAKSSSKSSGGKGK